MSLLGMASILRGVAFKSLACAKSYSVKHRAPRAILEVDGGYVVMGWCAAMLAEAECLGVVVG